MQKITNFFLLQIRSGMYFPLTDTVYMKADFYLEFKSE